MIKIAGEKRVWESAAGTAVTILWRMSIDTISNIQYWFIDIFDNNTQDPAWCNQLYNVPYLASHNRMVSQGWKKPCSIRLLHPTSRFIPQVVLWDVCSASKAKCLLKTVKSIVYLIPHLSLLARNQIAKAICNCIVSGALELETRPCQYSATYLEMYNLNHCDVSLNNRHNSSPTMQAACQWANCSSCAPVAQGLERLAVPWSVISNNRDALKCGNQ